MCTQRPAALQQSSALTQRSAEEHQTSSTADPCCSLTSIITHKRPTEKRLCRLHFLVWQVVRHVPRNPHWNNKYAVFTFYLSKTNEFWTEPEILFPCKSWRFLFLFLLRRIIKAGFVQLVLCYGGKLCKMLNRPECALMRLCLNHVKCLCLEKIVGWWGGKKEKSFVLFKFKIKGCRVDLNVQVNTLCQFSLIEIN